MAKNQLADWHSRAQFFQQEIQKAVVGMERAVWLITVSIFARGHVMLEGDVGVGKTTLLHRLPEVLAVPMSVLKAL